MVKVSVVIKALNEEAKIKNCIESALAAVAPMGGEVVLADSFSVDRTIEIAKAYPIKIAQLKSMDDRSCGVGAQLGYQHSTGEYIYILDGDMTMYPGFLEQAIALMEKDPEIAGVGGLVVERNLESLEFQARLARAPAHMQAGDVDRLDMGGLYRREAIEKVGYLTNPNLHSYEEFDLGIRLRHAGFRLVRIAVDAVDHYGHTTDAFLLLIKRWKSSYIFGIGEVLRAAAGQPHFGLLIRDLRELRVYAVAAAWLVSSVGCWILTFSGKLSVAPTLALTLLPIVAMSLKRKSVKAGAYSVFAWIVHVAALLRGLLTSQKNPRNVIPATRMDTFR